MRHAPAIAIAIAFVLLATSSASLAAAAPAPPGLPEAMASLQAGDSAAARKILTPLVAREPANVRAWRLLGSVCVKLKDADCAEAACRRSLRLEPDAPQALYGL